MARTEPDVRALVAQIPDVDTPGKESKFTGPDPKAAEDVFEGILAGGRESLLELIAMLRAPDDPEYADHRPVYVLHGLAVYVGRPDKTKQRKMFAEALASQLQNAKLSKSVKGFLICELQVAGGKEVVKSLGKMLSDEDLCEYAAQALVAIGDGAARQLRHALDKAKGKCRVTIVQNLGVVGDEWSVRALRKAVTDADGELRLAAAWALARTGDRRSVDLLLKAADAASGWERIKATQACLLLAENLAAKRRTKEAERIYTHLRDSRTSPEERHIRDAAEKALASARK